jgi:uncharacterized protein involved in type VI secretion and phage assembly
VWAYAFSAGSDADRLAGLQAEALEAQRQGWRGRGSVRSLRSGQWLRITQVPASVPSELLVTAVSHVGINNLPTDVRAQLDDALGAAGWSHHVEAALQAQAESVGYANAFSAIERDAPWRPVLPGPGWGRRRAGSPESGRIQGRRTGSRRWANAR